MATTKIKAAAKTRAAEIRAQLEAAEAEAAEFDKRVKEGLKTAGEARSQLVEELYELFRIEAETKIRHDGEGNVKKTAEGRPQRYKVDPKEEDRTAKLKAKLEELLTKAERNAAVPQGVHGS
ncbi:hypothetical protein [Nesterenkonia populi]|uniref:hypothetical protein n=1 Tax=Nesterenkonia populi TaxID=1591087 RepID=UPI0011BF5154|nr:hypothetical protein [Nesterenkonia populi]